MREEKKNKEEIEKLLDTTRKMLEEEQTNYNECKDKELKECYMENIKKIEMSIKTFEIALKTTDNKTKL